MLSIIFFISSIIIKNNSFPCFEEILPSFNNFNNFAKFIADEIIEYQKNGGDLSKLGTPDGNQHMKDYYQKKADEQKRKKELAQIKRKMTDEDLEEFLKWKENNKK